MRIVYNSVGICLSLNKSLVRDATKNEPFVEDPSKENVRQKNAASNTTPQRWKRNGSKRDRGAKAEPDNKQKKTSPDNRGPTAIK